MSSVAASTSTASEFRVLGPVEALRGGQTVRLGGPRQRWLLALLLIEAGRTISSDRLIDELWQGNPPRGADGTLRVYVGVGGLTPVRLRGRSPSGRRTLPSHRRLRRDPGPDA